MKFVTTGKVSDIIKMKRLISTLPAESVRIKQVNLQ
jgi:hypothetical protein